MFHDLIRNEDTCIIKIQTILNFAMKDSNLNCKMGIMDVEKTSNHFTIQLLCREIQIGDKYVRQGLSKVFVFYLHSRHFLYDNIVSQLKIVRYEISICVCFVLDFSCKSIKKVSQNMSLSCPTSNTEGLGNVMRL